MSELPLELLRGATRDSHQQVEAAAQKLGVMTSRANFSRHLHVLWQHHSHALSQVAQHDELRLRVERRVRDVAHDIAQLGGTPSPLHPKTAQPLVAAPALGVTYVIEGSRLGAYAIAKMLEKNAISTQGLVSVGGDMATIRRDFHALAMRINQVAPAGVPSMLAAAVMSFRSLQAAYDAWLAQAAYSLEP